MRWLWFLIIGVRLAFGKGHEGPRVASCGIWQKRDIEGRLISEMAENCKRVVIEMDYDNGVYVITYTGKVSKDGCPVALLQGWKDEKLIK